MVGTGRVRFNWSTPSVTILATKSKWGVSPFMMQPSAMKADGFIITVFDGFPITLYGKWYLNGTRYCDGMNIFKAIFSSIFLHPFSSSSSMVAFQVVRIITTQAPFSITVPDVAIDLFISFSCHKGTG